MRKAAPWLAAGAIIVAAGILADVSWRSVRPQVPEIGRKNLEPTLGQGVLLGVLGGLRTLVSDLTWIRSYVLWERRDRPGCEALMRAACALDPHSRYFWEQTGYVVGYDLAHWDIRRRGGYAKVPTATQERIFKAYARRGLDIFEEGLAHSRATTPLLLNAAQLAEIKLKDHKLAAHYYLQAAEAPDAPWYAARICAQVLWDDGQQAEAYRWFRQYWTTRMLPREDGYPDDLKQLRTMETVLGLKPAERIPRPAWER